MNKYDLISLIALFFIVLSAIIIIPYIIINKMSSCGANPIKFLIEKELETTSDDDFNKFTNYTYVKVYVYYDVNSEVPLKTYEYNWGVPKTYSIPVPYQNNSLIKEKVGEANFSSP